MYFSYFGIPDWVLMCHCISIHSAGYFTGKAIQNSQGYEFRVKMTLALVGFGAHEHLEHDGVTYLLGRCLGLWRFSAFWEVACPNSCGRSWCRAWPATGRYFGFKLSVLSKPDPCCKWFSVSGMLLTCSQSCTAVLEEASRSEGVSVLGKGILLFIFPY